MNDRLDTIKRLAQTDEYWRAYLDGMFDRRNIMGEPVWETYSNAVNQAADRSEYRTVQETRERLHRKPHAPA